MASRVSDCLVRDGTVTAEMLRAATARQAVYGGALDTALLELGAVDEPTLWSALADATGVPIPDAALVERPDPAAAARFDAAWSRRCRAVPVGQRRGLVQLCCGEPVDQVGLAAARAALGVSFELFVVPEVRLAAARQAVYGEPMPPRLLRVLARLLGAQPVRRWVRALAPDDSTPSTPPASVRAAAAEAPDEASFAEAEFDVPAHTHAMDAQDILETLPSKLGEGASASEAADEVARALAGSGEAVVKEEDLTPASGAFGEKIDTSPGRAAAIAGAEAVPRTTSANSEAAPKAPPARAPTPTAALVLPAPKAPVADTMTEEQENQLCLVAEDPTAGARLAALRVLRSRLEHPRVRQLADKLREAVAGPAEQAVPAASALGELRDGQALPALIDALQGPTALAQTAARALVEIAQQDFGQSRKKWLAWWETHKKTDRVDWLLEGLSHKSPEIRFASSEELRLVTGEYFGYHFDLPKREREEAKERWQTWWYQSGRARLPDRR
jgi:hypothetical protein